MTYKWRGAERRYGGSLSDYTAQSRAILPAPCGGKHTLPEPGSAMGMPEDPPSCPHCDEDHAPGKCEFKRGGVVCDWVQLGGD